jgi:hypothetical protein
MGLAVSQWVLDDPRGFLARLAAAFESRTGLAAVVTPEEAVGAAYRSPASRGSSSVGVTSKPSRLRVPRLNEGFLLGPRPDVGGTFIAEWDGFPPNPYCYLHISDAALDTGAQPSWPGPDAGSRWRERYDARWSDLPTLRRIVLSTRLLSMFW